MTGANSNITTSTITNASTISANIINATNLNTSNTTTFKVENFSGESIIVEPGTSKNTIQFNGNVSGNIVVAGNINGTITQKTNALAAISTSSSISKEVCVNISLSSTKSSFYADDTSSTQTYKVTFDAGPIYSALSSQNTTLTGLINTNTENITKLKNNLTVKSSDNYSDIYATTFHGALAGNASSATVATSLSVTESIGSLTNPVYFGSNGKPVACSGTLSLTAAAASALTTSTAGNASLPVYFSGGIPVACNKTLDVSITGNAVSINTSKYNSSNGTIYFTGMTKFNGENQTPVVISELDFDGTNIHATNCNLFLESVDATSMNVTNINGHTPFTLIQNSDGSKSYTYDTLTTKFSSIDTQLKEAGKIDKIVLNNDELAITDKSVSINISKSTNNGNINVNNKDITIYTLPTASSTAYGGVMVDSYLNDTSANPVENKVIASIVNQLTSNNPTGGNFESIYATTFHGTLDGYASSVSINENLDGANYEYIPIMYKSSHNIGSFTSVDSLRYNTSTNTLTANKIVASNINVSNNIVATGSIQAAYFNAISDKRLKTNIEKLPITLKACETINNLDLYTFNYKNNLEERSLGIMAQDIENLNIDGFNFTNKDSDGYLSIKESKLVYLLMAAIKEQTKKIEELEERIKSLEE